LGRYPEARQALGDAGPSPSRAVAALGDQTRAAMALSQRDFPGTMEFTRRVLAQPNLDIDLTVAAKSTLGAAQIASGTRTQGLATLSEAMQIASKSGSALLIADTNLAYAAALVTPGEAQRALEAAQSAQQWFAGAGNQEAEWRSWLEVSAAESALGHAANSRESAQKSLQLLATLEQTWDAENSRTYLSRPDIQDRRNHLVKLAGAR
jgi:ATP/maltotriose-dependent transcriptional regulator MalT